MGLWRTVLRVLVGCVFVGHGTQKLFGWFGGKGLTATEKRFATLGLNPAREHALAAGIVETGGGAMVAVGLETPFAAAALIGAMLTAIRRVHLRNGFWDANGGYEYNAVLIASLLALVEAGPGRLSLDAALGRSRSGLRWAALAFAAAAFATYAVDASARHRSATLAWLKRAAAVETTPEHTSA